jgi:hypothetical protein
VELREQPLPDKQAQVWKKHKPKQGQPEVAWYEVARVLAKRRTPASAAKFGDESRYTTNVEGFFGAQQERLQNICRSAARCCR